MRKACTRCRVVKPYEAFGVRAQHSTGRRSECQECRREVYADGGKERAAAYRKTPQGTKAAIENRKRWRAAGGQARVAARIRASESARESRRRASAKWRAANPYKWRAQNKVGGKVRHGHMPKASSLPCEAGPENCGGRHEYHHDSYELDQWLVVRVLCKIHHKEWHTHNSVAPYKHEEENDEAKSAAQNAPRDVG